MKTLKNLLLKFTLPVLTVALLFMSSCSEEEEEPIPEPVASFTVSSNSIFEGEEVTFTNTSTDATAYEWAFGDGETSTDQNPTHTYDTEGTYTVTLIASSTAGNDQATATITVDKQAEAIDVYYVVNDETNGAYTIDRLTDIGLDNVSITSPITLTGYTIGVTYDPANEMIYYGDDDNGQIVKVNLDGTGEEVLVTGIEGPRGMALNDDGSVLYVAERTNDRILSITLADNSVDTLYNRDDFGLSSVLPEGLAYHDGNLYITAVDFDAEAVWTAAADGSSASVTNIYNYSDAGYGYGIAIDGANDIMYFDNFDSSVIHSSDLAGSSVNTVTSTLGKTYGIALDTENGKMYLSDDSGAVRRVNLDGSGMEELSVVAERVNRGLFIVKTN